MVLSNAQERGMMGNESKCKLTSDFQVSLHRVRSQRFGVAQESSLYIKSTGSLAALHHSTFRYFLLLVLHIAYLLSRGSVSYINAAITQGLEIFC